MRCPDCNKFVSFDADTDPEIDSLEIDNGQITGSVRITNNCSECSQELKEANFDIDIDVTDDIEEHWKKHGWNPASKKKDNALGPVGHREFEVEDDGGSRNERMQDTDRKGRKIRSMRYMTHYYGASASLTVKCECGEEVCAPEWSDEIPGSGMDELV